MIMPIPNVEGDDHIDQNPVADSKDAGMALTLEETQTIAENSSGETFIDGDRGGINTHSDYENAQIDRYHEQESQE